MLSTAKILNTFTSSTSNLFSNDQTIQRPGSMSLPLNPQQLYHHSTSFTPSPTNPSGGLSLTAQLRSLQSNEKKNFPFELSLLHRTGKACAAAATSTSSIVEDAMMNIYSDRQKEREERTHMSSSNTKTKTAAEMENVCVCV